MVVRGLSEALEIQRQLGDAASELGTLVAEKKAAFAEGERLDGEIARREREAGTDPEVAAVSGRLKTTRANIRHGRKTNERAAQARREAHGQAHAAVFEAFMAHTERAKMLGDLRDWLLRLAEVEVSDDWTVVFDETRIPKDLRTDLSEIIAQYTDEHPHTYARMFKHWSSTKGSQRIDAKLTKGQADQLKMELSIIGDNLRVRVAPVGDEAELSMSDLCRLVEARARQREHGIEALEVAPQHPAYGELVEMTRDLPTARIRGGSALRADKNVARLIRALGVPDDEKVLVAGDDSYQSWDKGWVLSNRALRSNGRKGAFDLPLAALQGLEVSRVEHALHIGPHAIAVYDHPKLIRPILVLLARDWGLEIPEESIAEDHFPPISSELFDILSAEAEGLQGKRILGGTDARAGRALVLAKVLGAAGDKAILAMDDTALGSWKRGWVLTNRRLVSSNFELAVRDLVGLPLAHSGRDLQLGRVVLPCGDHGEDVLELLELLAEGLRP